MGYWKSKVLPTIRKVFKDSSVKKAAAAEASKSFDDSKEEYTKEFEEKKTELQPKVVEIYEALSVEIKTLVKEPKDASLKKYSTGVQKLLDELVKIEFPGAKPVQEASSKFGPSLVAGPISFLFEKVSTFIVTEEKVEEKEDAPPATTVAGTEEVGETTSGAEVKEKEIVVEEPEKKPEEDKEQVVETKTGAATAAATATATEPTTTKTEEPAAAVEAPKP